MRDEDVLEEIIDLGKRQGGLSYDDINSAFPSEFVSQDEMEDLLNRLNDLGIKVTGDHEADTAPEEVTEEKGRYEKAEDLVQAYFHSMGDIPVLLRNEEAELARRIEEGNEIIRGIIAVMPLYTDILNGADRHTQEEEDADQEEDMENAVGMCFTSLDDLMRDVDIVERVLAMGPRRAGRDRRKSPSSLLKDSGISKSGLSQRQGLGSENSKRNTSSSTGQGSSFPKRRMN